MDGSGSTNIQGFATSTSVEHGQTVYFKVRTDTANYEIDIYRIGYYGGDGARYITTDPSQFDASSEPACSAVRCLHGAHRLRQLGRIGPMGGAG